MLCVIVTGTGTAALSGICANNFSLVDNGTGNYTISPVVPFARAPQVVASAVTDNIICKLVSSAVGAINIVTENLSGTATDAVFHMIVLGSDASDAQ